MSWKLLTVIDNDLRSRFGLNVRQYAVADLIKGKMCWNDELKDTWSEIDIDDLARFLDEDLEEIQNDIKLLMQKGLIEHIEPSFYRATRDFFNF